MDGHNDDDSPIAHACDRTSFGPRQDIKAKPEGNGWMNASTLSLISRDYKFDMNSVHAITLMTSYDQFLYNYWITEV